jgi:hypothetical protein
MIREITQDSKVDSTSLLSSIYRVLHPWFSMILKSESELANALDR